MWRVLHFLSVLTVPLILSVLISCIKAKEEKADLGPEVPADQIDLALSKAVTGADLSTLAVGQYVNYAVVRRLESEESTINLGYTKVNVFDKVETATDVTFSLKIESAIRLADNTFETRIAEEALSLKKASPLVPASYSAGEFTAAGVAQRAQAMEKKPTKVTFHNLRETNGTSAVPAAAKNRPGCGGLSPCEIPSRFVRFDLVQWYNDETYQKIALDFAFSTVTPYLPFGQNFDQFNGLLITDCRATLVPVEGRTVYVRDCLNLEDFQK
jgi:hypothetical protein